MSDSFGFNPHMTIPLALRVFYWRVVKRETWRGIAWDFFDYDKNNQDKSLRGNQLYGMEIVGTAARRLGFKDAYSWPLN